MDPLAPSSLAADALARRLADLVGEERHVQAEFLVHLDEYDRRRAWAEAGFPSLWEYLLRVLHLREGAAWRRMTAMRTVRRFPQLRDALRDGRLCLSTLGMLAPVLTEENVQDVAAAASFKTKAEVERIVAALAPRPAPKDGIRKLPERASQPSSLPSPPPHSDAASVRDASTHADSAPSQGPVRATVRPVSAEAYS